MKLFIDAANVEHVREGASWGVLSGVTTNPTIIAKEGRDFRAVIGEICAIVDGPISAEATSERADGMLKEARELASWHPNVVVKIPMNAEGLKATHACARAGIRTNVTLVFSPTQALLAAKAGASMICPFIGRLDDIAQDGMDLIRTIVEMYSNYPEIKTEVVVASIRTPNHVVESALVGADAVTVPLKIIEQLIQHPLTDIGVRKFLEDWKKVRP